MHQPSLTLHLFQSSPSPTCLSQRIINNQPSVAQMYYEKKFNLVMKGLEEGAIVWGVAADGLN